jgi:hypothetical protein
MRLVLAVLLVTACRYSLDSAEYSDAAQARLCKVSMTTQSCLDADNHSDFTFVYSSVIKPKCVFDACHDGKINTPQGMLDLKKDQATAFTNLTTMPSMLDSTRMLVVAGNPHQSFLTVMLGSIKPTEADPPLDAIPHNSKGDVVGTMPQNSSIVCCQKLDAVDRWITAGAMNN